MPPKIRELIKRLESAGVIEISRTPKAQRSRSAARRETMRSNTKSKRSTSRPRKARPESKNAFIKYVEWSEADQCYVGNLLPDVGPCCHGLNETDVYRQLCRIANEWIEIYKKDGIPLPDNILKTSYSGKWFIRGPKELHKALVIRALQTGKSLNAYCVESLRKSVLSKA